MKIEDHRESATFRDIEVGECFEYDGDICMKVIGHIDGIVSNAVDLQYGALVMINDEVVRRVDAKVVID